MTKEPTVLKQFRLKVSAFSDGEIEAMLKKAMAESCLIDRTPVTASLVQAGVTDAAICRITGARQHQIRQVRRDLSRWRGKTEAMTKAHAVVVRMVELMNR